jgi:hypothetical protein
VAYPFVLGQPLRHYLLARVQRVMAGLVARSAERVFVSIPTWEDMLAPMAPGCRPVWLPVPSNLPHEAVPGAVAEVRRRCGDGPLVGHFGTYAAGITAQLEAVFPALLEANPRRAGLLIGRGSEAFAERLLTRHPALRERLRATGMLDPDATAAHLAACDLLVQPYHDGASTRRTSLMAGLALGRPTVTTQGRLSEPLWQQSGAVALAAVGSAEALLAAVEALLSDGPGRAFYDAHFSPRRLIASLRREAGAAPADEDDPHGNVGRVTGPNATLLGARGGDAAWPLALGAPTD